MSINFGNYTDENFAEDERTDAASDHAWELHRRLQIEDYGACDCGEPAIGSEECEARKIVWQRGDRACEKPICAACAAKQQVKIVSAGGTQEKWETYCADCLEEHRAALEDAT